MPMVTDSARGPWLRPTLFAWVAFWVILCFGAFAGLDQINYQAAGERLNAGHQLYVLGPGDRLVILNPPFWSAPLIYPPLIAVIWRPIAALAPIGPILWWIVNAAALLAATAFVARRSPTLVAISAVGIGLSVAAGNVACLLIAGTILAWDRRDDPRIGAIVGVLAVTKVVPAVLILWLVASRRWRAMGWAAGAGGIAVAVSLLAGPATLVEYVSVARGSAPEPMSLAGLTGLSPFILAAAGGVLVLLLPDRWSHRVAVATMVLGSPSVGVASSVVFLALGAPNDSPAARTIEPERRPASGT